MSRATLRRKIRSVALAGILAGVAVVLAVWAFLVPIFQSPDEPVHADYAFSILTAGHLIHARDGAGTRVANSLTTYLIDSADFYRIAFHGSMRVPPNYGTRTYFAALDANAPPLQTVRSQQEHSGKVNWLTAVYPFAYYALEAVVMGVAYHAGASITAAFFAGRLLSVVLTVLGLYFGYLVSRMCGLRPVTALLFIAAVGLFPLTTFIGSYIQPDNLGFFAVALTMYATLRCLNRAGKGDYIFLGFSLAMLLLTKTQYFLPVGGAALFALVSIWASKRISSGAVATSLASVSIPIVVAAAIAHDVSAQPRAEKLAGLHSDFSFAPLHAAVSGGFPHFAHFVASSLWSAFSDYFISGQSWQSYWGAFGWLDVQMIFINPFWSNIIHITVVALTLLTMILSLAVIGRNLSRLVRVKHQRGFWSAARLASRGVPLNSFAVFVVVMLMLYVATGNVFRAQGRNWYPLIIPSFLCFVLIAPRITRRVKARARMSAIAAALLLGYSVVAAPMALATIHNRYYGFESLPASALQLDKALAAPMAQNDGIVDGLSCGNLDSATRSCVLPPGIELTVSGWAVDPAQRDIGSAVLAVVDDHSMVPANYDLQRADVAQVLHDDAYRSAGFVVRIPPTLLRHGAVHRVQIVEVLADESTYQKIGAPIQVHVSAMHVSGPVVPRGAVANGFVDGVSPAPGPRGEVTLSYGAALHLSGWAVGAQNVQYGAVIVTADGKYVSKAIYPLPRPDVMNALHEALPDVGFRADVSSARLGLGRHLVRILALSGNAKSSYEVGTDIPVIVVK